MELTKWSGYLTKIYGQVSKQHIHVLEILQPREYIFLLSSENGRTLVKMHLGMQVRSHQSPTSSLLGEFSK
jgi:hypothetical protein